MTASARVRSSGLTSRFVDQFDAYWHLGRADELTQQLAAFGELGKAIAHPTMIATAARCRALVADAESMDARFAEAARLQANSVNVFEHARLRLLWGMRLRRSRRKADARTQLREAERGSGSLTSPTVAVSRSGSEAPADGTPRCGYRRSMSA